MIGEKDYWGKGIGTEAIKTILDVYPGTWIITSWPDENRVAFWRHVLKTLQHAHGIEYAAGEHNGYPGQYVWQIDSNV